ncbi:MAG: hypothetical protein OK436_01425 [Thaumarchaeota archaeon]|nr:hypothetical protein [Nitrososphaerota archaeon]
MTWSEPRPRKPEYRVPVAIPTNWCLTCQLTLRTDEEYRAHIRIFPTHNVKPVTKLLCPSCGAIAELEDGRYSEHWIGYKVRKCPGSGTVA